MRIYCKNQYRNNNKQINVYKICNDNDVKICFKCKQNKPITEYYKDMSKSDGLRYICKTCQSFTENRYLDNKRQINANKIYNDNEVKTCYKCTK